MIKAFILDDQDINITVLRSRLTKFFPEIQLCGESTDPEEAIQQIIEEQPDLLFLDILMPGLNGFEFMRRIGDYLSPEVIFVTAYEEFALQAFECQASGYITKPVDSAKLALTVNKAIGHIRQRKEGSPIEDRKQGREDKGEKRLPLPTQKGIIFIAAELIYYCESKGNYTISI